MLVVMSTSAWEDAGVKLSVHLYFHSFIQSFMHASINIQPRCQSSLTSKVYELQCSYLVHRFFRLSTYTEGMLLTFTYDLDL